MDSGLEAIIGLVFFAWWCVGMAWLIKEQHWGWAVLSILLPPVAMIYAAMRYVR